MMEFRKTFDEFFVSHNPLMMPSEPGWRPPMDVFDTADYVLVRLEVAGMEKKAFEIVASGDRLIIRGHRPNLQDVKRPPRCYRQMEIKYTSFEREVLLNRPYHEEQIEATYHNGFLEVKVPVRKEKDKKDKVRIPIQEGS
jgi:HSP20 family protein